MSDEALISKINKVSNWLEWAGWAKNRELPDHMAANIRTGSDNKSLADLVYDLLDYVKELPNV